MIGAAKTMMAGLEIPSNYRVDLNPGSIVVSSRNGSASSPNVLSTVVSGVGPFTYAWSITGSNININSPLSDSTNFSASGFETNYIQVATLTVTDQGNSDAETTRDINISFTFFNFN